MKRLLLLPALITGLACMACSDTASTPTQSDGLTPLFDHKGKPHGKPGPNPSDPGVPLEITLMGGAFDGDFYGDIYNKDLDGGGEPHLAANGNLMFDLRDSERFVQVTAMDLNDEALDFDAKTRTYTNNSPTPEGLLGEIGPTVLESEWRTTEPDGDFFYSLRYGKDCSGAVTGTKASVSIDGSTWTITGVSGVLCRKKQKGKPGLTVFGSGGAFVMTLKRL